MALDSSFNERDAQDMSLPTERAARTDRSASRQPDRHHRRRRRTTDPVGRVGQRPGTPTDQAWIETLFGHIKAEFPHLDRITDTAVLRAELEIVRERYNAVPLHAGVGDVAPNDEHERRGNTIRFARKQGLAEARERRIAYHRQQRHQQPPDTR